MLPAEPTNRYRMLGRSPPIPGRQLAHVRPKSARSATPLPGTVFPAGMAADEGPDDRHRVEAARAKTSRSAIRGDVRLNSFFTQTENFPRLDHYLLGQPLLGDRLTWYEHTAASYSKLQRLSPPTGESSRRADSAIRWPGKSTVETARAFITDARNRHARRSSGPSRSCRMHGRVRPTGARTLPATRSTASRGQAGVRGSIPFWTANPNVESKLLNVHGIAHKIVLDRRLLLPANEPEHDELAAVRPARRRRQERFPPPLCHSTRSAARRRCNSTSGSIALRSGLAELRSPTPRRKSPTRLTALRFGARQRWQTKRGPPEPPPDHRLDHARYRTPCSFPNANRDNFGAAWSAWPITISAGTSAIV